MSNVDGKDRPTARGHRFGPDLTCSECGLSWEEHQASPGPCTKVTGNEVAPVKDLSKDPSKDLGVAVDIVEAPADSDKTLPRELALDPKKDDPRLD
jgi:hypothetical protein